VSQSRSGRGVEEKNSQTPSEIEPQNPDLPVRSPALYRLSYHGSFSLRVCVCMYVCMYVYCVSAKFETFVTDNLITVSVP
jgi:hypothetical protein